MPDSRHPVSFTKRAELVLISIAEDSTVTVDQRLAAIAQLQRIKQVKPKRKVYDKSKAPAVRDVLGTR